MKEKVVKKENKHAFHKWKKQVLIADKIITVIVFLLFALFRPDYLLIIAYILLIPYFLITERTFMFKHMLVSSAIAFLWMMVGKNQYAYNQEFLLIFGINTFSLFAWALGLLLAYMIYSHYEHVLKKEGFLPKLLLFVAFYWPLLIAVETIAYHVFNIHNVATAAYQGLPLCNCMHAPAWMKAVYFMMGPLYFSICYALKLENPNITYVKKQNGSR